MTALYIAGRRFAYGGERELLGVALRALARRRRRGRGPARLRLDLHARPRGRRRAARLLARGSGRRGAAPARPRRGTDAGRRSPLFRDDLLELLAGEPRARSVGDRTVRAVRGRRGGPGRAPRGPVPRARRAGDGAGLSRSARATTAWRRSSREALGRSPDAATVELLADGLRRTMDLMHGDEARGDARPKFPKRAVLELARAGSEGVARLLGAEVPRRVRVEAGLQILARDATPELAVGGGPPAAGDFSGVDGSLRLPNPARALSRVPRGRLASGLDRADRRPAAHGRDARARAAVELAAARGRWRPPGRRSSAWRSIGPPPDEEVFELAREVAVRRADDGAEALEVGAQFLARCDGRIAAAPAPDLREALSVAARWSPAVVRARARGGRTPGRRCGSRARGTGRARGPGRTRRRPRAPARGGARGPRGAARGPRAPARGLPVGRRGGGLHDPDSRRRGWARRCWRRRRDGRGSTGGVLVSLGRGAGGAAVAPALIEVGLFALGGERPGRGVGARARAGQGWPSPASSPPERWRAARGSAWTSGRGECGGRSSAPSRARRRRRAPCWSGSRRRRSRGGRGSPRSGDLAARSSEAP